MKIAKAGEEAAGIRDKSARWPRILISFIKNLHLKKAWGKKLSR